MTTPDLPETQDATICDECGAQLTIHPAPRRPWRIEHKDDVTHLISPPVSLPAGATVLYEATTFDVQRAFTVTGVGGMSRRGPFA